MSMIGVAMASTRKKQEPSGTAAQMLRAVRKAERVSGDGSDISGTGFTILKLRQKPLAQLIDKGKIGPEEIQAADEISLAFFALSSRLMVRGQSLDRVDGGGHSDSAPWPAVTASAVAQYTKWAAIWTKRANGYGDPTLQITIAAIIDERPIRSIASDLGFHHSKVQRAVICALRDYAARFGHVSRGTTIRWMDEAASLFSHTDTRLLDAVRRAKIER